MKFIITGGNGQIAKTLTSYLSSMGHYVLALSKDELDIYQSPLKKRKKELRSDRGYDPIGACPDTYYHQNEAI